MTENEKIGLILMFIAVVWSVIWAAIMLHEDIAALRIQQAKVLKTIEDKKGELK